MNTDKKRELLKNWVFRVDFLENRGIEQNIENFYPRM